MNRPKDIKIVKSNHRNLWLFYISVKENINIYELTIHIKKLEKDHHISKGRKNIINENQRNIREL